MWFWKVTRPICAPVIRALWRVRITGKEHIPKTGPAVLASNHLSILDHFLLPLSTKRPVFYLSKAEHFDHPVRGWFFGQWGAIPLKRGKGDKEAVRRGVQILEDGHLFGIYPEGTRSKDGRLYKGHTGAARIALEVGAPIIPCAMVGTHEALPKGARRPRFSKCEVRIGPPIDLSGFEGEKLDYETLREITDQVMQRLADLSGQEYVDEYHPHPAYATRAKQAQATGADEEAVQEKPVTSGHGDAP
jgi:1-acyl-sn-glycerol-3-phosphate acyltransferase